MRGADRQCCGLKAAKLVEEEEEEDEQRSDRDSLPFFFAAL